MARLLKAVKVGSFANWAVALATGTAPPFGQVVTFVRVIWNRFWLNPLLM